MGLRTTDYWVSTMWAEVLRQVDHRPWALPPGRYSMTMSWRKLLFAHWRFSPEVIRSLVPPALALDCFEGDAWLGIVPFRMDNVGPRSMPRLPWISSFLELNVRTYVTHGGKPGVYFFSLDAANPLAVAVARRWYHLPYFNARMRLNLDGNRVAYLSERTNRGIPPGVFRGRYAPTGPVYRAALGSLEHWLTERYCLYAIDRHGRVHRGEIHHVPWPLQPAEAEFDINTVATGHGLRLSDESPVLHYVESIDVLAWSPYRV